MVKEVNIFRLKFLTSTHKASLLSLLFRTTIRALQPGLHTHPDQSGDCLSGLRNSLSFSCLLVFYSLLPEGEKELFSLFILPGHFHQKRGYISTSDFNLCRRRAPVFCCCFAYDLCFPSIITSSSELRPTRIRMANSKNSRSVDSWNGFTVNIYFACLKPALSIYAFTHLSLISTCLFVSWI